MRALLDVNVLIAMFQPDHVHYRAAHQWLRENQSAGWASCPLTQNGFVRILSRPTYPGSVTVDSAVRLLRRATSSADHEFWADDVSLLDDDLFDRANILGPNDLTDVYLLALVVKNGGRLVTFDRGIPIQAVRGAEQRHMVAL